MRWAPKTLIINANYYPTIRRAHDIRFERGGQGEAATKSRWCPSVFRAAISTVRTSSRLTEQRDTSIIWAISERHWMHKVLSDRFAGPPRLASVPSSFEPFTSSRTCVTKFASKGDVFAHPGLARHTRPSAISFSPPRRMLLDGVVRPLLYLSEHSVMGAFGAKWHVLSAKTSGPQSLRQLQRWWRRSA
jgi:hypothetical protein